MNRVRKTTPTSFSWWQHAWWLHRSARWLADRRLPSSQLLAGNMTSIKTPSESACERCGLKAIRQRRMNEALWLAGWYANEGLLLREKESIELGGKIENKGWRRTISHIHRFTFSSFNNTLLITNTTLITNVICYYGLNIVDMLIILYNLKTTLENTRACWYIF